jgi:hypothetical protein
MNRVLIGDFVVIVVRESVKSETFLFVPATGIIVMTCLHHLTRALPDTSRWPRACVCTKLIAIESETLSPDLVPNSHL